MSKKKIVSKNETPKKRDIAKAVADPNGEKELAAVKEEKPKTVKQTTNKKEAVKEVSQYAPVDGKAVHKPVKGL
jgi:hypothetical protein